MSYNTNEYVCVAQLDRALGYGPRCREFESSRARMKKGILFGECLFELCFDMNLSHWEKPTKITQELYGKCILQESDVQSIMENIGLYTKNTKYHV